MSLSKNDTLVVLRPSLASKTNDFFYIGQEPTLFSRLAALTIFVSSISWRPEPWPSGNHSFLTCTTILTSVTKIENPWLETQLHTNTTHLLPSPSPCLIHINYATPCLPHPNLPCTFPTPLLATNQLTYATPVLTTLSCTLYATPCLPHLDVATPNHRLCHIWSSRHCRGFLKGSWPVLWIRIRIDTHPIKWEGPDPLSHQSDQVNPHPDPYQSDKPDPDPH